MSYVIIFILSCVIIGMLFYRSNRYFYKDMLIGTIVGKYKGDLTYGGYVVVEFSVKSTVTPLLANTIFQRSYKVPEEYYTQKNIGDKGMFPVNNNDY